MALALVAIVAPLLAARPARAATNLGITNFGAILADPGTGRVFVSGDDKVAVFNADGSPLTTLTGLSGAAGMSFDSTSLYVVERTGGAITRFDIHSLTSTGRFSTGVTMKGAVAAVGNYVWFLGADQYSNASLNRLDPLTGTVSARGTMFYGATLERVPGSTTRLLVGDGGSSSYSIWLDDITTNPVTKLAQVPFTNSGSLRDMAASDHGTFVTASGAPYEFDEFSLSPTNGSLPLTGVVYAGTYYPNAVAYSPAFGGLVAGTTSSSNKLLVAAQGKPANTHSFDLGGYPADAGVEIAANGSRAYAVTGANYGGPWSLSVFDLVPTLSTVSPTSVDQPATITLAGSSLAAATSVRVDGNAVPFSTAGTNALNVPLPTLTNGAHVVDVVTPWGTTPALNFEVTSQPGAPVVSELYPHTGGTAGGTNLTITGANFVDVKSVHLGDISLPFQVVGTSSITVTTPSHLPASVPVLVNSDHGTSNDDHLFSWAAPVPVVSQLTPSGGPAPGGTLVTIHGWGFSFASSISFGGTEATNFTVVDDGTITAVTPAHAAGNAMVAVTTPGGTSGANQGTTFTYSAAPPVISSLDATSGPATGGPVHIAGHDFTGASSVTFGGVTATFTVDSDSSLTVTTPHHAPGAVSVVVTTPNGPSLPATYTFQDPATAGRPRVYAADAVSAPTGAVPLTGDFNGDAVVDTFLYGPGAIVDALWTFAADGTHTAKTASVKGTFSPATGDFSGDGVDDIFWYAAGSAADYLQNFTHDGQSTMTRLDVNGTFQPIAGDFTGDGVDDILWYGPSSAPDWMWDFNSGGAHSTKSMSVKGTFRPVAGDFTGDGVDDVFWYAPGTASDYLQNFTQGGQSSFTRVDVNGTFEPFAGDFTGDGVDDIFWFAPGSTADSLWDFDLGGSHVSSTTSRNDHAIPAAGDFTGGGVDDIVWANGSSSAIWFLSPIVR